MARKKKEVPKKFLAEDIEAGMTIAHQEYFMQIVALLSYSDLKEMTFVKCPIVTPEGGTYLVSILHVEGPKVNLEKLAVAADAIVKEQKDGSESKPKS